MFLELKETDNYTLTLKHICCLISYNRYSVLLHATFIYTLCISFLVYLATLFQLLWLYSIKEEHDEQEESKMAYLSLSTQ
jgi:hypothetical protein